ncbi:uncharacterized protein LOC133325929 [Musca vetustissima]|uniref:uncharacterized protein LOC133325929 n=1 Tax=Musca vetustissima TaxID=27455 RepID=UPI002AB62705|nr:uncharacterized protein LOC133325929 [Musca vetustissima]
MKLFCVLTINVVLLLSTLCVALPLEKQQQEIIFKDQSSDDIDMDVAESINIPLVTKTVNQPEKNSDDTGIAGVPKNSERIARQLDIETAESVNYGLQANSPQSDDFDIHSQAEDAASDSKSGFRVSLFQAPVKTRESVNLETEAVPSKVLSVYDNSQKFIADKTQPQPILDTINEHEKYGNNGDMFDGISRSLVNGYEAFSNFLNTIIKKPQQIFKSINKSVNAQLDIIGGKLVGL